MFLFEYMSPTAQWIVFVMCIIILVSGSNQIAPYNASQVLWVKCYLVGSTVFWTLFYYILGKVLRLLDRKIMDADVNGYPVWNWLVGITHGAVILPIFAYMYYISMPAEWATSSDPFFLEQPDGEPTWKTLWSKFPATPMMAAPWERANPVDGVPPTPEVLGHRYLEQILVCCLGFLFKDFSGPLEWAFTIHHVCAIIGCVLCLMFPAYAGTVALNVMQCEFGSAIFDAYSLVPNKFTLFFYAVLMTTSNIAASDSIVIVQHRSDIVGPMYQFFFATMGSTLVVLRMGGVIMAMMKGLASNVDARKKAK